MANLKSISGAGWVKDANDNFSSLSDLVSGADGLGCLRVARFTFDTAIAANKAIGAHGTGVTLPANSIVVGGFFEVNTAFTSENTNNATIAISVLNANDIQTATAVSGAPFSTTGRKAIVPKANTPEATSIKVGTAAKEITCTSAVSALTAGKLTGYLYFVEGAATA